MDHYNAALGVDIDRETGGTVTGWAHVEQCLGDIFATGFGERVIREWYGSAVPKFFGENLTERTIVKFFAAMASAISQWEPRYSVKKITPQRVDRDGYFVATIDGEYRPLALIGNYTPSGARRVVVSGSAGGGLVITSAS